MCVSKSEIKTRFIMQHKTIDDCTAKLFGDTSETWN